MITKPKFTHFSALARLLIVIFMSTNAVAVSAAVCLQIDSDPDGDGWGWENSQSCVVDVPNGTLSEVAVTAPTVLTSSTAVCASSASDPDGDGWGWEDGQSCQATVADRIPVVFEDALNANNAAVPYCVDASSDLDNDGWGWEHNASCIIQRSSKSVQRVLAVGDSITHGVLGQTSYRKALDLLLIQTGCSYEFVGSQKSNSGHDGFISPHEGYSGHTADHFLFGRTDSSGANQGVAQSMELFNPDVVLLHIGSNDMRLGQNIDNTVSEIDQIISTIHQGNSSAVVLVANVIPWYLSAQAAVETLGDRIEAYVEQRSNPLIQLVDVRSGFTPDMMIWDEIHPNEAGDAHIADAFFNIYQSSGLCDI